MIVLVSAIHAHNLLAPVPVLKHSQRQSPACAALLTGPAVLLCLLCPPPRCSPAITLTCRRFQRLFYAESSLWRQCRVAPPEGFSSLAPADQEAWATAQAARLARVAPLVADVSLVGSVCQLAPLVALLQPASLRGLALEWAAPRWQKALPPGHAAHAAATAAALQRFPALTALELSFCPEEAEPAIPAALHRLPALRRLALRLANVPADIIAAAAQLQRLTFLRLSAGGPLPAGPVLLQLTRLQHLAHLELDDSVWPREHPLPLPPPSQYPALRSYRFAGDTGLYQVGACGLHVGSGGRSGLLQGRASANVQTNRQTRVQAGRQAARMLPHLPP